MKTLLAMLLCAVMLLSACALAEGRQVTVKNLAVTNNGSVMMDLAALEAVIDIAAEGDAAGARLDILANGSSVGSVLGALIGEQALLQINGTTSSAYALDVSSLDLSGATSSAENVLAEANSDAIDAVLEQLDGIVTDAGVTTMNGMEYQTLELSISESQMASLMKAAGEELDGMTMSLKGTYYNGEGSDIVDGTMTVGINGEKIDLGVYGAYTDGGANNGQLALDLTATVEGETYGLSMDVVIEDGDSAWLPASIGGAVVLTADEALDENGAIAADLQDLAQSVLQGAMSAILGQFAAAE